MKLYTIRELDKEEYHIIPAMDCAEAFRIFTEKNYPEGKLDYDPDTDLIIKSFNGRISELCRARVILNDDVIRLQGSL